MSELIEQVANAIADDRMTESDRRDRAIAAIRAVRAYDVAVGPSEAEIEAAVVAWLGTDRISPNEISHDDLIRALRAAAAERARVAEQEPRP